MPVNTQINAYLIFKVYEYIKANNGEKVLRNLRVMNYRVQFNEYMVDV